MLKEKKQLKKLANQLPNWVPDDKMLYEFNQSGNKQPGCK